MRVGRTCRSWLVIRADVVMSNSMRRLKTYFRDDCILQTEAAVGWLTGPSVPRVVRYLM